MLALTLAVMLSTPVAGDAAVARFGKPLLGLKATPLSEVLASAKDGATVRLEGKAETVCKKKGCWVTLRDGDASVHVTFEDYAFFVPLDSAGKQVALEGKVKVAKPDPADVAHLKAEGAGKEAASKVSVEAYGVELRAAPAAR
jgi:hypothetical protein